MSTFDLPPEATLDDLGEALAQRRELHLRDALDGFESLGEVRAAAEAEGIWKQGRGLGFQGGSWIFLHERRGRPAESPTGERRQEWRISVAPSARARVEAEAAKRGVSPSALAEELFLALPPPSPDALGDEREK